MRVAASQQHCSAFCTPRQANVMSFDGGGISAKAKCSAHAANR